MFRRWDIGLEVASCIDGVTADVLLCVNGPGSQNPSTLTFTLKIPLKKTGDSFSSHHNPIGGGPSGNKEEVREKKEAEKKGIAAADKDEEKEKEKENEILQ